MIRIAALVLSLLGTQISAEELKLAVTTSFLNSGLALKMLPAITADTGIEIHLLVVGTGQALRLGEAGDVDAVLVHAKAAEEAFVAQGFGTHRREIMYNDFVIVGPASDPADVSGATSAADAFARIAEAQSLFVSRGDDSGTHQKEQAIWALAGVPTEGTWYRAVGAGMGPAINTASAMNAYILADRASWLRFGNKGDLIQLYAGDPVLFNQYAYIPVNPARHPHIAADAAAQLEAWLTSPSAQALIDGYAIGGQKLFTFNAQSH